VSPAVPLTERGREGCRRGAANSAAVRAGRTRQIVLAALRQRPATGTTTAALLARTGLSRSTVRRVLRHLTGTGEVFTVPDRDDSRVPRHYPRDMS